MRRFVRCTENYEYAHYMLYNNINRTHHASDFYAQPGGTFSFVDYFMYQYPKQSLTIEQQMQPIFDKILSLSKEILISEQARDRLLSN